MKKLLLLSGLACGTICYAQKFELSAGYGAPSIYGITNELGSDIVSIATNDGSPGAHGTFAAAAMIYNNSGRWRFGLDYATEFFDKDNTNYTKKTTTAIMPSIDHFWSAQDKRLRFYSGIAAGVYLNKATVKDESGKEDKLDQTLFGFNLTPIGLRYGRDFSVFLEANVGTLGLAQAGLSYIF